MKRQWTRKDLEIMPVIKDNPNAEMENSSQSPYPFQGINSKGITHQDFKIYLRKVKETKFG